MSQTGPPADAKQAQATALQELENAQRKKRGIDTTLANLETSIWAFEGSYLDETAASGGNIIKGFDNYLKPPASGTKKKNEASEVDRLFSTSSVTFSQSRAMAAAAAQAYRPQPTSGSMGPPSVSALGLYQPVPVSNTTLQWGQVGGPSVVAGGHDAGLVAAAVGADGSSGPSALPSLSGPGLGMAGPSTAPTAAGIASPISSTITGVPDPSLPGVAPLTAPYVPLPNDRKRRDKRRKR